MTIGLFCQKLEACSKGVESRFMVAKTHLKCIVYIMCSNFCRFTMNLKFPTIKIPQFNNSRPTVFYTIMC